MTIAVLGAGLVGRAIAQDLAKDYSVTSFDLDANNLAAVKSGNAEIQTVSADLSRFDEYPNWLSPFDIVVTAVPGFMGYKTLEAVIRAGKDVADISFFPEDALQLDELARQTKVTAITDCGVAPGVSNFIIGRYNEEMDVTSFECYVGGLPAHPQPPFYYKAPSPVDVIQEYIRPARLVENGRIVTKEPLSEIETLHFDEVGELEAFNTDGLRSLIYTMKHIPDMKEKTLRYPGHADLIIGLKQSGFFDSTPFRIKTVDITPLDFTSKLLVNQWKLAPGEEEFTIMKVIVKGKDKTIEYDLLDRYDASTKTSSMARTTGYTCTAAVNLIGKKLFNEKGVFPPELVGKDKRCFDFVISYLKERNVHWRKSELVSSSWMLVSVFRSCSHYLCRFGVFNIIFY
jgi:saccharopine dehydrogenase-like NADP-dependent oxidoreductase